MKIFGRDPVLWGGALSTLVTLLVTFNIDGLSAEQAGLWSAAVAATFGAFQAFATRDTFLALANTATKAVLALGIGYGLALSSEQVGLVAAAVAGSSTCSCGPKRLRSRLRSTAPESCPCPPRHLTGGQRGRLRPRWSSSGPTCASASASSRQSPTP